MPVSPQTDPASDLPGLAPPAGAAVIPEKLLLLTHDDSLIQALASVVAPESLTVVANESALANHLLSGQAGVVFIDAAESRSQPGMAARLLERLHSELPDVVLVVAGDGAAQNELANLVADGTIYRFVHKPVSAQRVKLFVEAAWRKRAGAGSGMFPALSVPQPTPIAPMARPSPWPAIAATVAVVGTSAAWYVLHTSVPTETNPATQVQAAAPAPVPPLTSASSPSAAPDTVTSAALIANAAALHITRVIHTPQDDPDLLRMRTEQAQAHARRAIEAAAGPALNAAIVEPDMSLPAPALTAPPAPAPDMANSPAIISSTPPVSEARDPNSVAAITLERVYWIDPEFPELAREHDLMGFVDLEFLVRTDGSVTDVTVLRSAPPGVFDKSSIAAISQWRYRPVERDGVPVDAHARLRLNFGYK